MKKSCITFGSIIVGGLLLVGCSNESEVPSQKEVLAEAVNEVIEERKAKTGPFAKYRTVKEYVTDILDRWSNEAKTSEMKAEVVNDALVYADSFKMKSRKWG